MRTHPFDKERTRHKEHASEGIQVERDGMHVSLIFLMIQTLHYFCESLQISILLFNTACSVWVRHEVTDDLQIFLTFPGRLHVVLVLSGKKQDLAKIRVFKLPFINSVMHDVRNGEA